MQSIYSTFCDVVVKKSFFFVELLVDLYILWIFFIYLTAYQLLMGYLMSDFDSFRNVRFIFYISIAIIFFNITFTCLQ